MALSPTSTITAGLDQIRFTGRGSLVVPQLKSGNVVVALPLARSTAAAVSAFVEHCEVNGHGQFKTRWGKARMEPRFDAHDAAVDIVAHVHPIEGTPHDSLAWRFRAAMPGDERSETTVECCYRAPDCGFAVHQVGYQPNHVRHNAHHDLTIVGGAQWVHTFATHTMPTAPIWGHVQRLLDRSAQRGLWIATLLLATLSMAQLAGMIFELVSATDDKPQPIPVLENGFLDFRFLRENTSPHEALSIRCLPTTESPTGQTLIVNYVPRPDRAGIAPLCGGLFSPSMERDPDATYPMIEVYQTIIGEHCGAYVPLTRDLLGAAAALRPDRFPYRSARQPVSSEDLETTQPSGPKRPH